jgi:hypothetical protein
MYVYINTRRRNKFIGVAHVNVCAPELKPVCLIVLRKRQESVSSLDTRLALSHLRVFMWGVGGWMDGWVGGRARACVCLCVCVAQDRVVCR